jgi:uncharacterized protein YlzI (FlbEa/FlbD family)
MKNEKYNINELCNKVDDMLKDIQITDKNDVFLYGCLSMINGNLYSLANSTENHNEEIKQLKKKNYNWNTLILCWATICICIASVIAHAGFITGQSKTTKPQETSQSKLIVDSE